MLNMQIINCLFRCLLCTTRLPQMYVRSHLSPSQCYIIHYSIDRMNRGWYKFSSMNELYLRTHNKISPYTKQSFKAFLMINTARIFWRQRKYIGTNLSHIFCSQLTNVNGQVEIFLDEAQFFRILCFRHIQSIFSLLNKLKKKKLVLIKYLM